MKMNSIYFSREPAIQNQSEARVLTDVVNLGEYRSDTLYVFIDSKMWEIAKVDTESSSKLMVLDSVPILAPAGF